MMSPVQSHNMIRADDVEAGEHYTAAWPRKPQPLLAVCLLRTDKPSMECRMQFAFGTGEGLGEVPDHDQQRKEEQKAQLEP